MLTYSNVKKMVEDDYKFLTSLSTKEYILYKKWEEINSKEITVQEQNILFKLKNENNFTRDDLDHLNPIIIPVTTKVQRVIWTTLRTYVCSLPWNQNPGRHQKYLVKDKYSDSYIGVISLGSDFTGIGGRNQYIGWTNNEIMKQGMLKYTAVGSSIVPLQPFGYNFVGGKLIALLTISEPVINFWNSKYKEPLAGITTTSLYGGFSQYNSLKYWKKCKSSEGKVELEPSKYVVDILKQYMKEIDWPEYNGFRSKKYILEFLYKHFKIKQLNNSPRGVYFCELYDNTKEFLRREDNVLNNKKFDNSVNELTRLWKEKYAKKRVDKLNKENRMYDTKLFYDYMKNKNWKEVK